MCRGKEAGRSGFESAKVLVRWLLHAATTAIFQDPFQLGAYLSSVESALMKSVTREGEVV